MKVVKSYVIQVERHCGTKVGQKKKALPSWNCASNNMHCTLPHLCEEHTCFLE